LRGRISMKMSSRRAVLKRGSVAQHRPHHIDPPTRQGDESLSVPLALGPLAIVESPRLRGTAQAGKGRLVEDPLEDFVATTHPFVVTHPFAGVTGRRNETRLSSEPVGALEGADVAHGHQKLGPEDRSHAWGKLVRIRASARAKKRCPISSSIPSMRSLKPRTSLASSATIREATSCAGRVTL
jgi:hypothetical protein